MRAAALAALLLLAGCGLWAPGAEFGRPLTPQEAQAKADKQAFYGALLLQYGGGLQTYQPPVQCSGYWVGGYWYSTCQ